ncbi:MAG: cupin domain-containing protein [Muribaculaceae bacterium]
MSDIKLSKKGNGYVVATVGNLSQFTGKAFVKDVVGTTGMEMSITTMAAGEEVPFFHRHKQNEELYIVISGEGVIMLGGDDLAIASGSIVFVEPATTRCVKNTGSEPLVLLCVQAKAGSLEGYTQTDGILCER